MIRRAIYLVQMLRNASLPAATLAARQRQKLNSLVQHAAMHVRFYRDLYAAHGISPDAFNPAFDLQRLPIVTKQQLRAAGAAAVSVDAPTKRVAISTSGSSGEPFKFEIDRRYDQWRKAQYLRPYLHGGRRLRDKVLRLTAFPLQRTPWFSQVGLLPERQIDCGADPARIAAAWQELTPQILQGYPSSLRSLAHYCRDRSEPLKPAPRLVFTDSELLTSDTRALLEQQFGVRILDVFGTYETDNIAFECAAHRGYHIATDCVVLEIVRDGKPVPAGEEGEIVVTVLPNRTSPFIRYNLKDLGRLSTQPCSCGLPYPLLTGLQGRADDVIVLAGGRRRTPMDVLGRLDRFIDAVRHYQLRQLELGSFELLIVPSSRFVDADLDRLAGAVVATLENAEVKVRLVDAIPADPSGKRRAFVSRLAADQRA
jgi:phenylacetate-CoA ligase